MGATGFTTGESFDDSRLDQLDYRMRKYQSVYQHVAADLKRLIGLGSHHKVLEVGCAFGFTLEWLNRDFGCQVHGVEPSDESRQRCAKAAALQMFAGTAEDYFLADDSTRDDRFDVILFRHSLENIVDPRSILKAARNRLTPEGIVLIYTPNVEYFDIMNPYHPYIYSPSTLKRLLAQSGLEVFATDASPSPTSRSTVVRVVRPKYDITCAARVSEPRDLEYPEIDPVALAKSHVLGANCRAWSGLTFKELMVRMWAKLARGRK